MRGIGKSSLARSSLVASSAFVFVLALAMLTPTEASAQFGNIEGMIRGAIGHGGYNYRGGSSHRSSRQSSRHDPDSGDSGDTKPGAGDSKPSDGSRGSGSGGPQSAPSDTPPSPKGGSPGAPAKLSGTPAKSPDDEPAFAPSR